MRRFTPEDVGEHFIDASGEVWLCEVYGDQPHVQLRNLSRPRREEPDPNAHVNMICVNASSPIADRFTKLVKEEA